MYRHPVKHVASQSLGVWKAFEWKDPPLSDPMNASISSFETQLQSF